MRREVVAARLAQQELGVGWARVSASRASNSRSRPRGSPRAGSPVSTAAMRSAGSAAFRVELGVSRVNVVRHDGQGGLAQRAERLGVGAVLPLPTGPIP